MIQKHYTNPKHVRPSVGALGGRDEVQGVQQGAQGAALCAMWFSIAQY